MRTLRLGHFWATSEFSVFASADVSASAPMTQRPHIGGDGGKLGGGELRPAHGRHWSAVLLRLRDADGDGVRDRSETAIAPYPLTAGEVGPQRRALGVRSVTAGTRRARDLALVDAPPERDFRGCCSWRRRQRGRGLRTRIRMDALRRNSGFGRGIVGA